MTNYSRTTLRELKKRYLNILKKCLLANLLAFSFVLPSMAEDITERISIMHYDSGTTYLEDMNFINILTQDHKEGGALYLYSNFVNFKGATFSANRLKKRQEETGGFSLGLGGGAVSLHTGTIDFSDHVIFGGDGYLTNSETGEFVFDENGEKILLGNIAEALPYINAAGEETSINAEGGALKSSHSKATFTSADFIGNKILATKGSASGGAIMKFGGSFVFLGDALFKNNIAQGGTDGQGGAIWNHTVYLDDIISFQKAEFYNNQALQTKGSYNRGGAIWNNDKVVFNGEAIFGKYVLDENGNKTYDANGDVVTLGNKAISEQSVSSGGAILHASGNGFMTFGQKATFIGNIADGYTSGSGGAIWTSAPGKLDENGAITEYGMEFGGEALFADNMAKAVTGLAHGGSINNWGGSIRFNDHTTFNTNKVSSVNSNANGGAIYNRSTLNFTSADFINNSSVAGNEGQGGAIYNESVNGNINFIGHAKFENNTVEGNATRGGAIYNNNNSVIQFSSAEFLNNTAISSNSLASGGAIFNNLTSLNFSDDTTFTGNKTESVNGSANGGAIYNSGYMLLAGENTFGGYLQDTEDAGGDGDKTEYVLDSAGNKISLGNEAKYGGAIYNTGGKKEGDVIAYGMTLGKSIFMGNTALSYGGAIFNSGYMNFTDEALFDGNTALSYGGAIYNTGYMNFTDEALFDGNESISETSYAYGGAIRNEGANAVMTFKGNTLFTDNKSESKTDSGQGGAIYNQGIIQFNGEAEFVGNSTKSQGGAISNSGTITFGGLATFEGNTVDKGVNSDAYGGAIANSKNITFKEKAIFKNNEAKAVAAAVGGAIFHYDGTITFEKGFEFVGNKIINNGKVSNNDIIMYNDAVLNLGTENSISTADELMAEGGIKSNHSTPVINKYSQGNFILRTANSSSNNRGFTGIFNQYAGTTIADSDKFFNGTNNITGGELRVHGSNMSNLKVTVGENALLTFLSTSTSEIEMKLGENVSVAGDVKFGADESVGTAKYHLKDDVTAKTITIQDSILTTENETFEGAYIMGENVTLDMQDGDMGDPVSFANLTGSANLKIDADIVKGANGLELVTDQIETNKEATLKLNLTDVVLSKNALDNGLSDSYTAPVMTGGTLTYGSEKGLVATDIYSYEVSGANNQITIDAVKFNEDSDVMKSVAEFDGDAAFNMTIGGDSYAMKSDVTMTENTKSIVGKDKETSTLTAKKITVNGATLNVENVAVSGENQLIDVASGTLNVTNAKVENIENAGKTTLNTAEVSEFENSGTLTANSSEIGELVNGNKAEVTGGKVAKVTNNGALTVTGATITELLNEHEAIITGGELETATNKEKGMLSLSAGLRAGTVTNEGELTLDGVTVADLTNKATLKANGSTLTKLVNEQEVELTALTVEDLTNMGTMTAKDLTLKGALKGEGTATLSGKLVADDIFKSENKIISDGMEVSENVKKMELDDLEIKEGTTLDIGTRDVTAKDVKVGDKATLQVTLNNLDEFGTMAADKIEAGAGAGVHLVLGEKFEGGVFDVFKGTKGAGDLEVKHNNLYNVIEVEEGKYSFMTKDTEALQESLGATKEEVSVADAMTKGTSTNEAFNKVQSEVLIALQSLETEMVAKAKKALSAVGAKEHPIEQSVSSEHLVALQNVVQAELHGSTVGHSGGEEEARAKVYIKGLYDRTKSSMGEGFRARSKGAVLGIQSEVTDTLTLGVGYATSQTTAKEDLRRTEVDTNTGFISAHYQPNAWWVSGLATFSRGEYEEEKQILSSMGKATYDVDSWGAQVMTGYDIKLENAIITPEVGMRYLSVKQEGYTDTLGTTVAGTRSDYLTALVGVKGTWDMGAIRPTAGVTVGYDVISDDVSALNTLANGASYTVNGEALDRLSTGVSLGVEADLGDRTTLKLEYSGTFRKEYSDHSGMFKLEVKF